MTTACIETVRVFRVPLEVTIRRCVREDLAKLEWNGLFAEHREIMESAFSEQGRGNGAMLVADVNEYPVGQIWIDLHQKRDRSIGILWALRVFPFLQRLGIGTALVEAAEDLLRELGFEKSELGVEKSNHHARRLYEHIGYRQVSNRLDRVRFKSSNGEMRTVKIDQWILQKSLIQENEQQNEPEMMKEAS